MYQSIDSSSACRNPFERVSSFRRISSQVIAITVKNLILIDIGVIATFPTILIPALTGISDESGSLSITFAEASWIGSIMYIGKPLGSMSSVVLTDKLGRKGPMIIGNIPFAIGWIMLYKATMLWEILFAFILFGFSIGYVQGPIANYVGEICEPANRGVLIAYSVISTTVGSIFVFALNVFLPWRVIALVCFSIPVISAISLCFIPETPQWLLSKHRTNKARESLRWLRGWATDEAVTHEFSELTRHSERSKKCRLCIQEHVRCAHALPSLFEKASELKQKRNLKPMIIIVSLFFMTHFTGSNPMKPFIVQIFKAYQSPIPSGQAMLIFGVVENLASVIFMCFVRFTGKRRFYLTMCAGIFITSLIISCYGFIYLPPGTVSFNRLQDSSHLTNESVSFVPVICLYLWNFFSFAGFASMPWMFLSELLPFKSRVMASGLLSSLNYVLAFTAKKTYYELEMALSMAGVSLLYCAIAAIGLIWMYFIMPETEGRTLDDIELHFSDNSKRITDWKITPNSISPNNSNGTPTIPSRLIKKRSNYESI